MSGEITVAISLANLLVLLGAMHKVSRWMGRIETLTEKHGEEFDRIDRDIEQLHGRISRVQGRA